MQDFGEGHSFPGQRLIADSGRHQGSAGGQGVSPFLELALWGVLCGKLALGGGCLLLFSSWCPKIDSMTLYLSSLATLQHGCFSECESQVIFLQVAKVVPFYPPHDSPSIVTSTIVQGPDNELSPWNGSELNNAYWEGFGYICICNWDCLHDLSLHRHPYDNEGAVNSVGVRMSSQGRETS